MNCWRIQPLLVAEAEDELPHDEAEMVRTHLAECSGCASLANELASLPMPEHIDLPEDALQGVWAQLDSVLEPALQEACAVAQPPMARPSRRDQLMGGSFRLPRAAAAGYMFCLVALTGWNMHTQSSLQDLRAAQQNIMSAPRIAPQSPLVGPPMSGAAMDLQLVDYDLYTGVSSSALGPVVVELPPPREPRRESSSSLH